MESMTITSNSRLIEYGERKGIAWEVWMEHQTAFGFTCKSGVTIIHTSPAGYENAGRASVAAARWIDEYVSRQFDDADVSQVTIDEYARDEVSDEVSDDPTDDFAFDASEVEPVGPEAEVVAGWRLVASVARRGHFEVEISNADPTNVEASDIDVPEFKGYLAREQAIAEARTWALAHPIDGSAPPPADEPTVAEPEVAAAEPATSPSEPALKPAPAPAPRKSAARRQPPEATSRDWIEVTELADSIRTLSSEIEDLEDEKKVLTDTLKAKKGLRELHSAKLAKLVHGIHTGKGPGIAYQPALFGGAGHQEPLVDVGEGKGAGEAQAAADRLRPAEETWVCNAVEHTLVARETEPGRWRAWLKGHEADTEGFGEQRAQAVEACKARASIVFADCEPGSTTPTGDGGPVADGPRTPPKRGRKPKLKGKSAKDVEAALHEAMSLDDAASTLKCTTAELEGWARQVEFPLSKHLARDVGKDEPAPAAKAKRGGKRGERRR